jgi:hypothetical protein
MFGTLGIPELIVILIVGCIAALWPAAFFALGYYLGRRSVLRNSGVPPAGPPAAPPHD